MASGSYNIDTFSWYRSLPLSNDTTPFSTLTMFAVGPSSFMKNYTFYDYTWSNGFPDTSTFSVSITSFVDTAITSTTQALGKVFVSTIPYTRWFEGGSNTDYPRAGAVPSTYNFTSTFSGITTPPFTISTPQIWLGEGMTRLINSKQYNVFVDCQYSLKVNDQSADAYKYISTIGKFTNFFNDSTDGRIQVTRLGQNQYMDIHSKLMFSPEPDPTSQIVAQASSFTMEIRIPGTPTIATFSNFDLYIPGNNNFTFTLVPAVSSITVL